MKLKKIDNRTAVHCESIEQAKIIREEGICGDWILERDFPIWVSFGGWMPEVDIKDGESGKHYYESCGYKCVEFSDIILPELTAEEALRIYFDITDCGSRVCELCPLSSSSNSAKRHSLCNNHGEIDDEDIKEIVKICQQWKYEHEKKEPEIETVDICRIIEIQPNGFKKCVHEEDMDSQTIDETEDILKRYCMEHKGEFIAVHEVVSRVKAVE